MGYKFEVDSWEFVECVYSWKTYYKGNSLLKAFYYLLKLKLKSSACFKLTWRP